MTITRLSETHAEASDYEVILTGDDIERSTTRANTGAYSWRYDGTHGYMVLGMGDATAARTSLYLWMDAKVDGDTALVRFKQSLTADFGVEVRIMEDEETLRLYVDEVQQDEDTWTNVGFGLNEWIRISVVASSTQNYASVYLNDTKILTYIGAIANAPWDACRYGQRTQTFGLRIYTYLDDIYLDSMTDDADALPPAYGFMPVYTTGLGDHNDFVALAGALKQAEMVDDGAVDDGDTTYNFTGSSGGAPKDSFEVGDIVLPANHVISAAIPWCICRKLNAADDIQIINTSYQQLPLFLKEGAAQNVPLTYGYRRSRFTIQPDGSSWNEADFNSLQYGYKAGGSF